MLLVTFATAFVFTFNKWGTIRFDFERGLANLLLAFVFVGIFWIGQIYLKKIIATKLGYDTNYEWSLPGIIITVLIAFLSFGYIPILLLGTTKIAQNDRRRLGKHRFALNQKDIFRIHAYSYLLNYLIILIILAPIYIATHSLFINFLIKINLALIFFPLIPVPKNDGIYLFFASRSLYFLVLAFVVIMSLLILWAQIFSFIIALVLGLIFWQLIMKIFKI
jgi:Zn-dependent protease